MPVILRNSRLSLCFLERSTVFPPKTASPSSGISNWLMHLNKVDFPVPEGLIIPTTSPFSIFKLIWSNTLFSWKLLERFLISNIFIPFCYTLSYVNSKEYTHKERSRSLSYGYHNCLLLLFSKTLRCINHMKIKPYSSIQHIQQQHIWFLFITIVFVFIWFSPFLFPTYLICYVGITLYGEL